ncbi:MAG: hypothetical protein H7Z43_13160 [Clostridia bacterium]|nr:hypothetical protein [Deltaproteobacteria bacterium]
MSDAQNPYAAPIAPLQTPVVVPGNFTPNGRAVDVSAGVDWIKSGFRMFFAAPLPWLVAIAAFFGAVVVLSFIPFLNLALFIGGPVVTAGFFAAGEKLSRTGKLDVSDFFRGFRERTGELLIVGLVTFGASLVAGLIAFLIAGGSAIFTLIASADTSSPETLKHLAIQAVLGGLIYLALIIPVSMAMWFAPGLVLLARLPPLDALKQSFNACLKNFVPFLVFGLLTGLLFIAACIPLFLGLFVIAPAFMAMFYTAYVSIFET